MMENAIYARDSTLFFQATQLQHNIVCWVVVIVCHFVNCASPVLHQNVRKIVFFILQGWGADTVFGIDWREKITLSPPAANHMPTFV